MYVYTKTVVLRHPEHPESRARFEVSTGVFMKIQVSLTNLNRVTTYR
jgi:hypothetical protein